MNRSLQWFTVYKFKKSMHPELSCRLGVTSLSNPGAIMVTQKDKPEPTEKIEKIDFEDDEAINLALQQMETLYKSRCVQVPVGSNITIGEIKKDEE